MHLYAAKSMFRLLLPLYFTVFSVMPLSNIHIEGMQDRSSYLHCKTRQDVDIHLLLHEMLFAHFGNRSEHLNNSAPARFIKNKEGCPKDHLISGAAVDISSSSNIINSERLITPDDVQDAKHCLCFIFSDLSPPAA